MSIIVDPTVERLLAEMSKKTGKDATELLTAALTAHAQAIGVLPAPSPYPLPSEGWLRCWTQRPASARVSAIWFRWAACNGLSV